MRFPQAQVFVDFQVHLDKQAAVELVGGNFVHGEAEPRGDGADGVKQMLSRGGARLHVHHHVRGNNFADALLDGVGNGVHLLEAGGPRNADRDIHEVLVSRAPHPHAFGGEHAFESLDLSRDALLQSGRRHVQQRLDRALSQP